jgi:hypothetical protein
MIFNGTCLSGEAETQVARNRATVRRMIFCRVVSSVLGSGIFSLFQNCQHCKLMFCLHNYLNLIGTDN